MLGKASHQGACQQSCQQNAAHARTQSARNDGQNRDRHDRSLKEKGDYAPSCKHQKGQIFRIESPFVSLFSKFYSKIHI
jgi:hypothetical protein